MFNSRPIVESSQSEKADLLKKLHHSGKMLVLPNIWDAAGAALLEKLGYPAVATASAAVARAHGFEDGENIPFDMLLAIERGCAYAGADCIYPIFLTDETAIKTLMAAWKVPVNVLAGVGAPDLEVLRGLGVARVSFGPNVHRAMLLAMEGVLREVRDTASHLPVIGLLG